ncbi:MAG: DUF3311 domain-containing protein [Planctomycetes bacterium]|nr:DUF3311 domain-containing protein [Planctomycetota bacterium]
MRKLVYALIVLLLIVHQDFWWWDTYDPLVFGFIPIGLAYHAGVSLAAAILWALAIRYCWPAGLDDEEPGAEGGAGREGEHA